LLDGFALSDTTYMLFYTAIDILLVFAVIFIWGIFRLVDRRPNPPRLHFWEWMKGFELNPMMGFLIVLFPITAACVVIRFVMADIDPLAGFSGDMKYVGQIDEAISTRWRHGRVGICILALGFLLMQEGSVHAPRSVEPIPIPPLMTAGSNRGGSAAALPTQGHARIHLAPRLLATTTRNVYIVLSLCHSPARA
jgi:hypothetical protein